MEDETGIRIAPVPEKYLNLRPQDTYDENIEALEEVLDGEYGHVGETYGDMHPRVFHMAFSDLYHQEGPEKADSEALEMMQEVLEDNSGGERFWPEEKLFNFGYRLGPKPGRRTRKARRQAREKPYVPFGREMLDLDTPMPENPVRKGRLKRLGDRYYADANQWLGLQIADREIEIV
jgi:hypothetical protein